MVCVHSHKPVGFSYSIPDGRENLHLKMSPGFLPTPQLSLLLPLDLEGTLS